MPDLARRSADLDLEEYLLKVKDRFGVPGLAAAASIDGRQRCSAAVGIRKIGCDSKAQLGDKWHVGSCTKAMTATLAGLLIDKGELNWSTTIGDVLIKSFPDMHRVWRKVTLEQLLSHHGGARHEVPAPLWRTTWANFGLSPRDQRSELVKASLTEAPQLKPGSKFQYSNTGYAIAGHMLETLMNTDFESLLKSGVFEPLGMASAGFGAPGKADEVDQPVGHSFIGGELKAVNPGPKADNPPAIAPAGTVHCSIEDFLRFVASHACHNSLVSASTRERLHRRHGKSEYSCGWIVAKREWGGGKVLTHSGSNTYWLATMWIAPLRNAAFVAACNLPQEAKGHAACDEAVGYMLRELMC